MKRVSCIRDCKFEPIPGLVDGVLDDRWLIDISGLADSLFDVDLEGGIFKVKDGDHLFFLGSANCDSTDVEFYVLIRNVPPVPKHIFLKKLDADGKPTLRYSYASEIAQYLGGLYIPYQLHIFQNLADSCPSNFFSEHQYI